ncbi:hypothetical protein M409DRAFT_17511 [Zasmidium cellare ATCC 36951]|uniref:SET domain-containing protein n=1 Tax=Zasmidium cellare ATCC 36951 TaxID=1080233 RepID=A0A6A6D1I3_ZASCE|nr:uncharacterized protein M409DRAFT_17511 [Zasmidium cellare ATCC 36951]KAF2172278.1 hypothetical protein M409DRAFT_17511 [Zasmidium cellare ATCC 36951]
MSPPESGWFEVRDIPNAGRGVIARCDVPAGTLMLQSGPPAFHVVFKLYGKETCAYCFHWDRGRTLPIRDHTTAKVFCSESCRAGWAQEQGKAGVDAWLCLADFLRARGRGTNADEEMGDGARPQPGEIETAWQEADRQAKILRVSRESKTPQSKLDRKATLAIMRKIGEAIDSDVLSYLLCGLLYRYKDPTRWADEVLSLAMDDEPYKTQKDLESNCNSYLQLVSVLPLELLPLITPELCRTIVRADNHNAFGIRSGGEDSEEYMGYGVYPSASYFNHSCAPNLKKQRVGRQWQFTAGLDISLGDQCCISYLGGDERDMNFEDRQRRLKEAWGFDCGCGRCTDERPG